MTSSTDAVACVACVGNVAEEQAKIGSHEWIIGKAFTGPIIDAYRNQFAAWSFQLVWRRMDDCKDMLLRFTKAIILTACDPTDDQIRMWLSARGAITRLNSRLKHGGLIRSRRRQEYLHLAQVIFRKYVGQEMRLHEWEIDALSESTFDCEQAEGLAA